ncbi:PREDICTED: major histocompatibility complex class I-related gene protein-like [Gekko japonicus]|uniref:Major histocompatibility complex class I-related gene protein-like n=1 Tax=Gekko japonicus TaxID=146911 RepID=A0ABM1JM81_GEKJA|nr:PREDICTED: major histocompatibility complex class I-related gene protein-like [Gekko japonicus]
MGLSPRGVPFLGGVALLLMAVGCSGSSSSHFRNFYLAVSEPGPGLPQFIAVGYVNDQPIDRYDSHTRRNVPVAPWMEEVRNEDPQYWERNTQILQDWESVFRGRLVRLREHFNQQNSTGLHTLQRMEGCEVGPDGQLRGGHYQYAYDGEDFLALDLETVTWTARVPQAQETMRQLERETQWAPQTKYYLEGECVEWLRRYLGYGKETLLRTEAPVTRVARKKGYDGQETLFCQLYGFYPKDIEVTWMKDGEDRKSETMTGGVVPNSDGTYHTWLSIEVDPKEKGRYRCRVEHDSLLEPLDLAWEEPASNLLLIVGVLIGVLSALLLGAGVAFYRRQHHRPDGDYALTPVSVPEA